MYCELKEEIVWLERAIKTARLAIDEALALHGEEEAAAELQELELAVTRCDEIIQRANWLRAALTRSSSELKLDAMSGGDHGKHGRLPSRWTAR